MTIEYIDKSYNNIVSWIANDLHKQLKQVTQHGDCHLAIKKNITFMHV